MNTESEPKLIQILFRDVYPINSFEKGLELGEYTDRYPLAISEETFSLIPVMRPKNIWLVGWTKRIDESEWSNFFRDLNYRPCANSFNYLLGLMSREKEETMPLELEDRDIVAAEESLLLAPLEEKNGKCFPCVLRRAGRRGLGIFNVHKMWSGKQVILVESLLYTS